MVTQIMRYAAIALLLCASRAYAGVAERAKLKATDYAEALRRHAIEGAVVAPGWRAVNPGGEWFTRLARIRFAASAG